MAGIRKDLSGVEIACDTRSRLTAAPLFARLQRLARRANMALCLLQPVRGNGIREHINNVAPNARI